MYKSTIIALVILSFFMFFSCNSKEKQEKLADERLHHISELINKSEFNSAKLYIDSIHLLFPRLIEKRKIAAVLADTILRRESSRTLEYCNNMLLVKQNEADSIEVNFRFEKNDKYQDYGNFIYKNQITEHNTNRNYLKTYVDENADLYLVSNFTGLKLQHTTVEVNANDLFAHTDSVSVSDAAFYCFTDNGTYWESLTFKNQQASSVVSFISQYSTSTIQVILHGKRKYVYQMQQNDKKAIAETYNLWIVLKDIKQLKLEINKAQHKLENIKNRNSIK